MKVEKVTIQELTKRVAALATEKGDMGYRFTLKTESDNFGVPTLLVTHICDPKKVMMHVFYNPGETNHNLYSTGGNYVDIEITINLLTMMKPMLYLELDNKFEEITYTLPAFVTCYLFYGDESGISEEDKNMIDSFMKSEGLESPVSVSDYPFFAKYHDLPGCLPGDCLDFTFLKRIEE